MAVLGATLGAANCGSEGESKAPFTVPVNPSEVRVKDGDTVLIGGQEVRMLGIDAPEDASDHFQGDQEPHASQARSYLQRMLDGGKKASLVRLRQRGKYNRILGYIIVDGRNLNAELVRAGLAYETITYYGYQGIKDRALEVVAAAREGKQPAFENPVTFRRNRKNENQAPR